MKKFLLLFFGNSGGQLIPILLIPLITRLCTSEEFGIYSIFISISSILAIVISGRLDLAIAQAKSLQEARLLFFSSHVFCLLFSFLLLLFAFLVKIFIPVNYILFQKNLFLGIIAYVFLLGIHQNLNFYFIYQQYYVFVSLNRFLTGLISAGLQLLFFVNFRIDGLIWGLGAGVLLTNVFFLMFILMKEKDLLHRYYLKEFQWVLKNYKNYPLLNSPGSIIDSLSIQLPILMVSQAYSVEILGYFSLAYRSLNLPVSLVIASLTQILLNKMTSFKSGVDLTFYLKKLFWQLMGFALLLTVGIYYLSGELYVLVFGRHWALAGQFASFLALSVGIKMLVSPLSTVMLLEKNIRHLFFWQLSHCLSLLVFLNFFAHYPIQPFIWLFTAHEFVFYLFYLYLIFFVSKSKDVVCVESSV